MECPNCGGGPVRVKNTRYSKRRGGVVRVRHCDRCGHEWRTVELDIDDVDKRGTVDDMLQLIRDWNNKGAA